MTLGGEIIWQRSYGGAAYATILPAEDNRFIIGGNLGKVGRPPFGGWLLKIDGATGAPVSGERGEVWSYSYARYNVSIEVVQT